MDSHGKVLTIDARLAGEEAVAVLKALGSECRLRILQELGTETRSVNQLGAALGIPAVTAAMHVKALEEAGLITTKLVPASRGLQKVCSRRFEQVVVELPPLEPAHSPAVEVAMPIGAFVDAQVAPPCGLATAAALVGLMDDPASFFDPERLEAQVLWFRVGFVEYRFPYRVPPGANPTSLCVRMEICSEAPTHAEDWPSDITLWVNGVEVGTWTSPGDFGGVRGALTPPWWLDIDSQFGLQKRWEVNGAGTALDGVPLSDTKLDELGLGPGKPVTIRLGVKPDARHANGLNLFGRKFGNYPEDLVLRIAHEPRPR
jgi:predicted transcriptional regulator